MVKLSACPFCNSDDLLAKIGHDDITFIICRSCGACTSFIAKATEPRYNKNDSIKRWNKRDGNTVQ